MAIIRVSEESARKLKFFGKTYEEAVKAVIDRAEANEQKIDYDKIRGIVSDELIKVAH